MTSTSQQVLTVILFDNISCIITTTILYDYLLTFSEEVEYVWSKPWTWVSTLFVLARYFGMGSVVIHAICNMLFIVGGWCFWIFLCSADLVMILRLWALYARSKFVLGTLLALYAIEVIGWFTVYAFMDSLYPGDPPISVVQTLGASNCTWNGLFRVWDDVQTVTQFTLGGWMFILLVFHFIKGSLEMYKATRQFTLGEYHKRLVWEGLAYFIIVIMFGLVSQLADAGLIPQDGWEVLALAIQQVLPFTIFARFFLNLRALYERGPGGIEGEGMDTAFGLTSLECVQPMAG